MASENGTARAASKITTSQITATVAANKAATAAMKVTASKTLVVAVEAAGAEEDAADSEEDTINMLVLVVVSQELFGFRGAPNRSTTSCRPIAVTACS